MAGYPVVFVDAGGLPVTYGSDGNGWPIEEAASGLPVTIVAAGGLPVSDGAGGVALHFLGDSMLDDGLLVEQVTSHLAQSHTVTSDGVGGTTLTQQAARWALTPQHWGKALISVDALASGDGDVTTVDGIVANLRSGKFLYVEAPIYETNTIGTPGRTAIDAQLDGIRSGYSDDYLDSFDAVQNYNGGTSEEEADVANGIWPRSFRYDEVHPNTPGNKVWGEVIASAIIARGWDGVRAAINQRAPVISNDGTDLSVFDGIWFEYPASTPTYQWYKNGAPLGGATSATYTLLGTEADDEFYCAVTRGGVTANSAPLLVSPTAETAYSTEANALINAMDFPPDTNGRVAIAAAMTRVQALAAKLDWFCAPLHNQQASLINWLDPTREATMYADPVFTPGQGWTTDPLNGDRFNTNYYPNVESGAWTLNSAHIGMDVRIPDLALDASLVSGDDYLLWRPRQYTTTGLVRLNTNTDGGGGVAPYGGAGHHVVSRATNAIRFVKNGAQVAINNSNAPTNVAVGPIFIVPTHAGETGAFHFGGTLSDADCLEIANILEELRSAFTVYEGRDELVATVSAFAGTVNLPNEAGGVFQERTGASATTAASADGDLVGSLKNFGTRAGWRTAAADGARPTLKVSGDRKLLRFATDDALSDTDPYLYAAGSGAVFFAIKSAVQAATAYLFAETSTASGTQVYVPGTRMSALDRFVTLIRNNAGVNFTQVDIGSPYSGFRKVVGFVDTGSSIIPYVGKTAGTAISYTRSGTLTLNKSALGALINTTTSGYASLDLFGAIAMGGVPTEQQISDIVDLLEIEAGI